jgi:hypothetical protein
MRKRSGRSSRSQTGSNSATARGPDVRKRKAVKWNSPFYGIDGQGWFLSFHAFTHYVKVTFFRGTALRPVPPGASKHKDVR